MAISTNLVEETNMNTLDLAAYYISALLHDIQHPGKNNIYQINAVTKLALRYNGSLVS